MTLSLTEEICPVSLELLGELYRADDERLADLLIDLSETTRAKLAVYLYGRSHTHELGLRVAAGCDGGVLRRAAGVVGNAIYEQSRLPYARPSHGENRPMVRNKISLGGARASLLRSAM